MPARPSVLTLALRVLAPAMLCLGAGLAPALAQSNNPPVPAEMLDRTTPLEGDNITFCTDPLSRTVDFDKAVAQAIADVLLVRPSFKDLPTGFPIDAIGYLEELLIAMTNECQVALGFSLQPDGAYPTWLTITSAYASIPYLLVVRDADYASLADIPKSETIGTAMQSQGEARFITYNLSLPRDQQWRRLPYADPALMAERLKDATLGAMIVWSPTFARLVAADPALAEMTLASPDPLRGMSTPLAAILGASDTFLRSQIDGAIAALIADGTIARLLDEAGLAGAIPGE